MSIFTGTYGSHKTPCEIFCYNGWYCVDGGMIVNRTHDQIEDGTDVETLRDYDCFTWGKSINTIDELIKAVDA